MYFNNGMPLVADLLPLQLEGSELGDHKRQLNELELLQSVHLLAPAGEMVLPPGVACSTHIVSQNHLSCLSAI
jgi:hypothetical protein